MELQVKNLTKQYGSKTAVDHLTLTLTNGVYGFLGPNGAGKTTFMRLLCNLQKPTDGTILLNGCKISSMGENYTKLLGYLPQNFTCYPEFTAKNFLLYMAALKGLDAQASAKRTQQLLEYVGLSSESRHKIKTFSGGMKQRLGIAQAMLNHPKILILDEPTAGLDPKERVRFQHLVSAAARDRIVLLSTHIISDIERLSDEIIMMKKGKIVFFGVPKDQNLEDLYLSLNGQD